jgi:sulfur carrier protein
MEVFIEKGDEKRKMRFSGSVAKLLSLLKLSPESVVVVKDGEVVTEDELLSDKDKVKILSVVSGG